MRLIRCVDKDCWSSRGGFCHDTCMLRLVNFSGRDKEGICANWKPPKGIMWWVDEQQTAHDNESTPLCPKCSSEQITIHCRNCNSDFIQG